MSSTLSNPDLKSEFRRAMRRLASTVSVISCSDGNGRYGITATAVASLSMDPASLVVCINRNTSVHAPILLSSRFCVSLLRESQSSVAHCFAGGHNGGDRFESGDWAEGSRNIPYLRDAQANIFCDVEISVPYASHTIFIGRVTELRIWDQVMPLLYCDGEYASTAALVRSRGGIEAST